MRATICGKQIREFDGRFFGINLGYNFYMEHEVGIEKIPFEINNYSLVSGNMNMFYRPTIGQMIKLQRKILTQSKAIRKWDGTVFKNLVLYPCTEYVKREITIDNTNILNKYKRFLTKNGKYTLLYIGITADDWRKKYGDRRKFAECELLYMPDYNTDMTINPRFMMSCGSKPVDEPGFAAAWQGGLGNILILMSNELESEKHAIDGIINAIKNGNLAMVSKCNRLFLDRGLILLDLEVSYNPRSYL